MTPGRRLSAFAAAAALALCAGVRQGERMYTTGAGLYATLAGSQDRLTDDAARCINCHGKDGQGLAEAGLRGSDIRPKTLGARVRRRGGPPSRYDAAGFCAALRTGIDPAGVVLGRGMPRYQIPASGCRSLWDYLLELQRGADSSSAGGW